MILTELQCFHCGEDCQEIDISIDDKHFCCDGCKNVYQLLSENNLDTYYHLENSPGTSLKSTEQVGKYSYLDLETVQEDLITFRENGLAKITFVLPQIHCNACIYLLENLPRIHKGIKTVIADFLKRQATITFYEEQISLRQLVELLASIGYNPDLTRKNTAKKTAITNHRLIFNIGITGFCFGNIMLLSFPEYLTIDASILAEYQSFFATLNFLLALPVLIFGARDYFISAWTSMRQQSIGIDVPIVIGILALFLRSSYEIFTGLGAGYMDSFTGLIFFLLIGKWYQSKTYESLSFERDYASYFPIATTKLVDEQEEQIMINQLNVGDIIKIRNEEIIPTDSILLSPSTGIDYSFVSGESDNVDKYQGDKIYAGGRQKGETIILKVLKKVDQSYFTQLWNQDIFSKKKHTTLSTTIDKISQYFTIGILSIAFITLAYWLYIDASIAIMAFASVLIIACPCALALSAPFAFGNMLRIFGKEGFFLKNAAAIEQIASVTDIIFDKTGTLTTNDSKKITYEGLLLTHEQQVMIKSLAQHSTHPLSQMLYKHLELSETQNVEHFKEYKGQGIEGIINGITIRLGSAEFVNKQAIVTHLDSCVYVSYQHKVVGCYRIKKQYRKGFEALLKQLEQQFDLHLLSGDNDAERTFLKQAFKHENMHFYQKPEDKLNYIKTLQQKGKKVLMIGDGLNDAGAMQQAEVGVAITNDVHSFSPASDAILDAKQFHQLSTYIALTKQSLHVMKASFIISLLYNGLGLFFAVQGMLTPLIAAILMPLSSITVVLFVVLATNLISYRQLQTTNHLSKQVL